MFYYQFALLAFAAAEADPKADADPQWPHRFGDGFGQAYSAHLDYCTQHAARCRYKRAAEMCRYVAWDNKK